MPCCWLTVQPASAAARTVGKLLAQHGYVPKAMVEDDAFLGSTVQLCHKIMASMSATNKSKTVEDAAYVELPVACRLAPTLIAHTLWFTGHYCCMVLHEPTAPRW